MRDPSTDGSIPRALNAPDSEVVIISDSLVNEAIEVSRRSPRRRVILPFHTQSDDSMHRMLNAIQPLSYIQPHRHASPPKAESFIVLRGAICFITFSDSGEVDWRFILRAQSEMFGIDIKPGRYHTFFAIEDDTVLFEVKPGPYDEKTDKDFASWAPKEGSEGAAKYLEYLMSYFQKGDL